MRSTLVALAEEPGDRVLGKHLLNHLYIHKNYVHMLPVETRITVAAALRVAGEFAFDLVKIAKDGSHVCLLSYPTFDTEAHPALKYSIKVLLPTGQFCVTDFSRSGSPPILHRKESMVTPEYPMYSAFVNLTLAEEKQGLLNRPDIGTRKKWKELLASKNLIIKGHVLSEKK